jgi:hypothetical protein
MIGLVMHANKRSFQRIVGSLTAFATVGALCGCTYQSVAVSTAVPAEDVTAERVQNIQVDYFVDVADEFEAIESKRIGRICTAHKYPLNVVPAVNESIDGVLKSAFAESRRHDAPVTPAAEGSQYAMEFRLESFESILGYMSGTWTGSAHAESSINLSFTVRGPDGSELLSTSVAGDGSAIRSGGCDQGSVVLSESASKAIEEAVQTFVYKVIDSRLLEDPVNSDETVPVADSGTP